MKENGFRIGLFSVLSGVNLLLLLYVLFFKENSVAEAVHKNLASVFAYGCLLLSSGIGLYSSYTQMKRSK